MNTITFDEFIKLLKIGDIGLTENPNGLGKIIKWFQELEGDDATFTHAFLVGDMTLTPTNGDALIYESNKTINLKPISQYFNKHICIIRHKKMTKKAYKTGIVEVLDNISMIYPWYRLGLIAIDTLINWFLIKIKLKPLSKLSCLINFDRPICSELVAQFLLKARLKTLFKKGECWTNINPDDIHDAALSNPKTYEIIFDGKIING